MGGLVMLPSHLQDSESWRKHRTPHHTYCLQPECFVGSKPGTVNSHITIRILTHAYSIGHTEKKEGLCTIADFRLTCSMTMMVTTESRDCVLFPRLGDDRHVLSYFLPKHYLNITALSVLEPQVRRGNGCASGLSLGLDQTVCWCSIWE